MKPNEPDFANPPAPPTVPVFFAKGRYIADAPPTAGDDQTKGFYAGSTWYVPQTGQLFTFVPNEDITGGVWIESAAPLTRIAVPRADFSNLKRERQPK